MKKCAAILASVLFCTAGMIEEVGAVSIDSLRGTRCRNGVALSYIPDSEANAESPELVFYIDTDCSTESGLVMDGIGADYKYSAGKLYCYTGDGTSVEWDAVSDPDIAKALRKGRFILFFGNGALEVKEATPVKVAVRIGEGASAVKAGDLNIVFPKSGTDKLPVRRTGNCFTYNDPAGDVSPACRVDFIKCFVQPHPKKPDTLMFGFTSDFPIEHRKLAYHLRLMLRIGDGPGANANGEIFDYMIESPNKLLKYDSDRSGLWKWKLIGRVPVRFTKQWCEIDLPLDMLPEKPKSIKFRFNIEHSDYAPDQRCRIPEYKL